MLTDEFKMQADLVNLRKARNLDSTWHQNIIIGVGIKMFQMHKKGIEFLEKKNFGKKNPILHVIALYLIVIVAVLKYA